MEFAIFRKCVINRLCEARAPPPPRQVIDWLRRRPEGVRALHAWLAAVRCGAVLKKAFNKHGAARPARAACSHGAAPRAATAPLRVLGAEVLSGGAEHAGKRGKVAGEGLRKALAQLGQKAELDEVGSPAPNPQRFAVCRVD